MEVEQVEQSVKGFADVFHRIENSLSKYIVGQRDVVQHLIVGMFAGGHVLLEGAPGLGKTRLVKALSEVFALQFGRIQFTPDLMPVDVLGTNIMDAQSGNVRFQPGPVFVNILLADEINRATPKTQSALLEAMEERTVTMYGSGYQLPKPFFVIATQNPLEMEGTYPLPEAQLDRFLFKLVIEHPPMADMRQILDPTMMQVVHEIRPLGKEILLKLQHTTMGIPIAAPVKDYAIRIYRGTNPQFEESPKVVKRYVRYGVSPRGAQALTLAARVWTMLAGRYHVSSGDIRRSALAVLRHRIVLNFEAEADGRTSQQIIEELLENTPEAPER
jgi:MoxR-like ATPase